MEGQGTACDFCSGGCRRPSPHEPVKPQCDVITSLGPSTPQMSPPSAVTPSGHHPLRSSPPSGRHLPLVFPSDVTSLSHHSVGSSPPQDVTFLSCHRQVSLRSSPPRASPSLSCHPLQMSPLSGHHLLGSTWAVFLCTNQVAAGGRWHSGSAVTSKATSDL